MYKGGTARASITLFMCLTIMMIASLGFTLMEVSRFLGVDKKAEFVTASAADNAFSEYIRPLWEEYGILGIDRAHGSDEGGDGMLRMRILDFASMQLDGEIDYFALSPMDVNIDDYMLLTDNDGEAFIHEAATYYKDNIAGNIVSLIQGNANTAKDYEKSTSDVDKLIGDSNKSLKDPSSVDGVDESYEPPPTSLSDEQIGKGEVLLDDVTSFQNRGVLSQVIGDDKRVSDKSIDLSSAVSHRQLEHGNSRNSSKASAADKVIFSLYLKVHFQSYVRDMGHTGQRYELEYIIAGNGNDTENLKGVVTRLLALREASDFVALVKDAGRNAQALELATAIAGATCNPVIIEMVHYGIMAAWAYMEAVLDVRLLLNGGKVALIKSSAMWTSDLYNLAACTNTQFMARDDSTGQTYEDYLISMLVLESSADESMRALDMIETSMNALEYYEKLRMDRIICDMDMTINYEADPMFFSFITLDATFMDFYDLYKREYRSFL